MRKKTDSIKGICIAEVCGACPEALLNACAANALEIWDMECIDSCTLRFYFYESCRSELEILSEKCMCQLKTETVSGGSKLIDFVKRHLALFVTALLALVLLSFSTLFVWKIEVYGNDKLSRGKILRTLSHCGVDVGCFWPGIDRELLRSSMLLELPELAWMTVNLSSSRAEVLVRERQEKPEIYKNSGSGDLICAKTGIVKRVSALEGKTLVAEGAAVTKGETLISGFMDSITAQPRAVRAQGSVMAQTWYELHAVAPKIQKQKADFGRTRRRFALKFGERRFNFYPGGRKTVDGCDKIIDNYIIGIDGVFSLPVTLVVERITPYSIKEEAWNGGEDIARRLEKSLTEKLDGEITSSSLSHGSNKGLCYAALRAACYENIAVFQPHGEILMP